jgi:hypothetical protein
MSRVSKKEERRNRCPKKRHYPLQEKTGAKKDNLAMGFKPHENALNDNSNSAYIAKIK